MTEMSEAEKKLLLSVSSLYGAYRESGDNAQGRAYYTITLPCGCKYIRSHYRYLHFGRYRYDVSEEFVPCELHEEVRE
jgi:hypothetical protein